MPKLASDADTIAAVATPLGEGGIGVVRVSGPRALEIVRRLFRPAHRPAHRPLRSHALTHGHILAPAMDGRGDGDLVDEVLVAYFRAPRSYTGEEMVEISAHGGQVVLRRILALVCEQGARLANPGEFTQRAFLNGRMDLAQAEAVADIIRAKTEASLRAATAQLTGALSDEVNAIRDGLIHVLAEVEAQVDFPEEDLDFDPAAHLCKEVVSARERIDALLKDATRGRLLRDGLSVVILGKPNVGKSSLLNAILRDERAIVTAIPGTTRDIIEEYVNLQGIPVRLTDTAGIRPTEDPIEREGVRRSRRRADEADLLLIVLDTAAPLDAEDRQLLQDIVGRPRLVALNKADLPRAWDAADVTGSLADETPVVSVSAKTGSGLDTLLETIATVAVGSGGLVAEPPLVTNLRHQQALREAGEALEYALTSLELAQPPELVAVDLRGALNALGGIVGETTTDEILDEIFSQFCIGK